MSTSFTRQPAWSDAQLKNAVNVSGSWRGVLRELGLNATSAAAIRTVRRHAVRLGLDTSHFRGKRTWSDAELLKAVAQSTSWDEVLAALGLSANSGNVRTHVKGHAVRVGLDISHLSLGVPVEPQSREVAPDLRHLREAGTSIATYKAYIVGNAGGLLGAAGARTEALAGAAGAACAADAGAGA